MASKSETASKLSENQTEAVQASNLNGPIIKGNNANIDRASNNLTNQTYVQQYNKLITAIKPHVEALIAAGASIASKKIAEIAGAVWDEFKSWSHLKKLLVVLATAAIVGAVGYFSWKIVAGNWDLIKEFVFQQYQNFEKAKTDLAKSIGENVFMMKFLQMFENKVEVPEVTVEDAKNTTVNVLASTEAKTMYASFLDLLKVNTNKYASMRDEL